MVFTSFSFAGFFAAVYGLLLVIRNDVLRRWILLLASFLFYGFWNAWYLLLIIAVIVWSWGCGLYIAAAEDRDKKKRGVAVGVVFSLGVLAIFKYSGFFLQNVSVLSGLPVPAFVRDIVLPVGISFYTFHSISYYVDVYRKQVQVARSLRDYAIYIAFFPQLVAGPIVRASQFLPQLARPVTLTTEGFLVGLRLTLAGAAQKLLLADQVSPFVDSIFHDPRLYSGASVWLGVLGYAVQIFGDFSGYTLMAIGIARILGYQLPQNFAMPYRALSITEFWQRWHITLSFFLRDYLYIPLGGNRRGFARSQVNVMVTMLLGGLWHGASWNFVIWGGLHGGAIVINRIWHALRPSRPSSTALRWLGALIAWALTFLFVILAWIPFRAATFDHTMAIFAKLTGAGDGIRWAHTPTLVVLIAVAAWYIWNALGVRARIEPVISGRWLYVFEVTLLVTLLVMFAPGNTSPFIYFQF